MSEGEPCKFTWMGRDGKDHYCMDPKGRIGHVHHCDCGMNKYGGPDPTAWRKQHKAAVKGGE